MNEQITWSPGITLEEVEKQVILRALRYFRGNKTAAANSLGITDRTLYNKLEKYQSDMKDEEKRRNDEQQRRNDFLERSRGNADAINAAASGIRQHTSARAQEPNQSGKEAIGSSPNGDVTEAGIHLESAEKTSTKHGVSMPERQEVQSMPPKPASIGGVRKNR